MLIYIIANLKIVLMKQNKKQKGEKMAEVKWTKEQQSAIYEKGKNILVAAAARKWKNSCIGRKNNK